MGTAACGDARPQAPSGIRPVMLFSTQQFSRQPACPPMNAAMRSGRNTIVWS